jgi:hypothetical protein
MFAFTEASPKRIKVFSVSLADMTGLKTSGYRQAQPECTFGHSEPIPAFPNMRSLTGRAS